MDRKTQYPVRNSLFVFSSFALVGGFLEAYTYLLHGGVFCNAQTGNLVLLFLNLLSGQYFNAGRYLFSILAYCAGILISALLPVLLKGKHPHFIIAAVEILSLIAISFIPLSASDWYTYVSVAFLCALQYNTFTECHDITLATTFCTNNIRQTILFLQSGIREKNRSKLRKSGKYALVIFFFALGVVLGGVASKYLNNFSAIVGAAILLPAFFLLAIDEFHRPPLASHAFSDSNKSNPPQPSAAHKDDSEDDPEEELH